LDKEPPGYFTTITSLEMWFLSI